MFTLLAKKIQCSLLPFWMYFVVAVASGILDVPPEPSTGLQFFFSLSKKYKPYSSLWKLFLRFFKWYTQRIRLAGTQLPHSLRHYHLNLEQITAATEIFGRIDQNFWKILSSKIAIFHLVIKGELHTSWNFASFNAILVKNFQPPNHV